VLLTLSHMNARELGVACCCLWMLAACGDEAHAGADAGGLDVDSGASSEITFVRHQLSDQFFAEGAAFADFDHDGAIDVVSGPFVYLGPSWSQTRRFKDGDVFDVRGYSDNFFAFVYDFDADTWSDVLIIAFPGDHATWYQNPQGRDEPWAAHRVFEGVDNESPTFTDIDADGRPELVCNHLGDLGFAEVDWTDPSLPWTFQRIATGGWGNFTHGLGVGDVDGDGRNDVMLATGVFQQPTHPTDPWIAHAAQLSTPNTGGAQMFVDDVDGDGDADVITTLAAHGHGVAWFEQTTPWTFAEHLISGTPQEAGKIGRAHV
jgi:hypothetical protein